MPKARPGPPLAKITLINHSMDITSEESNVVKATIPSLRHEAFKIRIEVSPGFRRNKNKSFFLDITIDGKIAGWIRWQPEPGERNHVAKTCMVKNPDRMLRRKTPWKQLPMRLGKEVKVEIYEQSFAGWSSEMGVFTWSIEETKPAEDSSSGSPKTSARPSMRSADQVAKRATQSGVPIRFDALPKRHADIERGVSLESSRKRQRTSRGFLARSIESDETFGPSAASNSLTTLTAKDPLPDRPRLIPVSRIQKAAANTVGSAYTEGIAPEQYIANNRRRVEKQPFTGQHPLGRFCGWLLERRDSPTDAEVIALIAHHQKLKETGIEQYSESERKLLQAVLNLFVHVENVGGAVEWVQLARDMLKSFGLRELSWDEQWGQLRRWWRDDALWSNYLDSCVRKTLKKHNLI